MCLGRSVEYRLGSISFCNSRIDTLLPAGQMRPVFLWFVSQEWFSHCESCRGKRKESNCDRDHKCPAKPKILWAFYRSLLTPDLTQPFILHVNKRSPERASDFSKATQQVGGGAWATAQTPNSSLMISPVSWPGLGTRASPCANHLSLWAPPSAYLPPQACAPPRSPSSVNKYTALQSSNHFHFRCPLRPSFQALTF